jgi:FMN phosphatase YigB (HAD superfamily)
MLLDLGDTLMKGGPIDHEGVAKLEAERLRAVLADLGFEDNGRLEEAWPRYVELERGAARRSEKTLRQYRGPDLVRRVLRDLGYQVDTAQLATIARAWWLGFPAYGGKPFSDALTTLRSLKDRGLGIAIVNNGSYGVDFWRRDIEAFGWLPFVDAIVSSGDLIWRKPHPLLFERALSELRVMPEEALMVGDIPDIDVAGAKALGIAAVWKRNHRQAPAPEHADFVIDDLAELLLLDALHPAAVRG